MEAHERYKAARAYSGMNQKALAEKAGVTQASISDMETGRSKRSTYCLRIAATCGVSAQWLGEGIGEMLDGIEAPRAIPQDPSSELYAIRQHNLSILLAERFAGHQGSMATHLGKNATSISRLLARSGGKNLGEALAREFEAKLGLDRYALDQPRLGGLGAGADDIQSKDAAAPPVVIDASLVAVPLLEEVTTSGRNPVRMVKASLKESVAISKAILKKSNVRQDDTAAFTVIGDGMSPIIPDGATVAIDRSSTSIVDGKIYAVDHGGMIRLKYLYRKPGGGFTLRSFNRDIHEDEQYTNADLKAQAMRVIGRVFWYATVI